MATDPMRDRVLAIVSVIAQYVLEARDIPSESDLVVELMEAGYISTEIEAAFGWLEALAHQPPVPSGGAALLSVPSHRIFTADESRALSSEARGFLVRLRSLGILDDATQEEIIDRAIEGTDDEVSLDDLKIITALTVFARHQSEWHREVDCLLDEDWSRLYH